MIKYLNTLTLFFFLNTILSTSQAFELFQVVNAESIIIPGGSAAKNHEEKYSIIKDPEVISNIIAPLDTVKGYIPFNSRVGFLSFSILSPKKTKMYLEWDNVKYLYPRRGMEINFRRSGEYQYISFNATKSISGHINIYNSEDKLTRKLLLKIKYIIKKQRSYSQSLRTSIGKTPDDSLDSAFSYSINQRVNINDPHWSAGVRVDSDKSTSASFGYTW